MTPIEFLRAVHPGAYWCVVCIDPDGNGIETRTFTQENTGAFELWLAKWNGKRNIYWHVGRVKEPLKKKGERSDIAQVAYLHVDLDPRAGEDLVDEQCRIKALVTDNLPAGVPPPTWIIYSGGGFQCLWALKEPIAIDGNVTRADEIARYNMRLEHLLGGDATHDVSRILRLPGTLNVPGQKKIKKGRGVVLAEVAEYHEDRVYDISAFTPAAENAAPVSTAKPKLAAVPAKAVATMVPVNAADLDSLPVDDEVKMVMVQGHDPNDLNRWPSRSEAVFFVCCKLLRAGVAPETVYSILMDPNYGISESILEKGRTASTYAQRQVEQAQAICASDDLARYNNDHAVIKHLSGKCMVITEVYDPVMSRPRLDRQMPNDFFSAYANDRVDVTDNDGKVKQKSAPKWWFEHPHRREYENIIFAPGKEIEGMYNLWRGFGYEAKPGENHIGFLEHVRNHVCSGNEAHYKYLLGWMARAVQKPGSPGEVAVVMYGGEGVGKSFFANTFGGLFGRHFLKTSQPQHLVGHFNAHLEDCVVLFADEGFYAGDRQHASVLKDIITGKDLTIERKYFNASQAPNYLHILMASNAQWVVPASHDARRYFVLEVSSIKKNAHDYFSELAAQMKAGGNENFLHYLLHYDLAGYNVRNVPQTSALAQQKDHSRSIEEAWWLIKLEEGRIFEADKEWRTEVSRRALYQDYLTYAGAAHVFRPLSPHSLAAFLRSWLAEGWPRTVQRKSGSKEATERAWQFPPLEACREMWDAKHGATQWVVEDAQLPESKSCF